MAGCWTRICPLWHSLNIILSNTMLTKKYCFNKFNPNIPEVYGNWIFDGNKSTCLRETACSALTLSAQSGPDAQVPKHLHVWLKLFSSDPLLGPISLSHQSTEWGSGHSKWTGQSSRRWQWVVQERGQKGGVFRGTWYQFKAFPIRQGSEDCHTEH